jgi:general secretion pathway protein D
MKNTKCIVVLLLGVLMLASCALFSDRAGVAPAAAGSPSVEIKETGGEKAEATAENPAALQDNRKPDPGKSQKPDPGNSAATQNAAPPAQNPVKPVAPPVEADKGVLLNLEDVSLSEFCEAVFIELLKKNYSVSPALKDLPIKISVRMTKPIGRDKVLPLAGEILKQYGILLNEKDDVLYLLPVADVASIEPKFRFGKVPPSPIDGMVLQIIPLTHIGPANLDIVLRRYLSKAGTYLPEGGSNSLIIIDFPDRIAKVLQIVEVLDQQAFAEVSLKIIRPKYWEPTALAKQLTELLKIESIPFLKPREQPRGVYFYPIERLGELYVFYSSQEWLDRILYFVDNLDKAEALGGEERVFIYFPINTSAQDLGNIIEQLFGQMVTSVKTSDQSANQGAGAAMANAFNTPPQPAASPTSSQAGMKKKIIINESRNCLIFVISPSEWSTVRDMLEKLDIPAKQVLIEAVIGEVTLDDQFRLGVEWFIKNNSVAINKRTFSGQGGTEGGLGLGSVGFLYSLTADDGLFRAAINAFMSQNKINILSAPRIVGVDNKECVIRVGTEVPVVTSEAVTGGIQQNGTTGLLRSIQYRNTGVILTVKPTIHGGDLISLDISQEVSEAQTNTTSAIGSPLILNRNIKTSLIARNGQTIFIGGLISKNVSATKTGVPILSQIPLIGSLFTSRSNSERKTELIVLLTPHILSNDTELDYLTDELRDHVLPDIKKYSIKEIKKDPLDKK